jgi:hypothetical protein
MKFFKPEDFDDGSAKVLSLFEQAKVKEIWELMARIANAKLEQKAKVIYSSRFEQCLWSEDKECYSKQKALIINVEPIHECPKEYVCSECGQTHRLIKTFDLGPNASKTYKYNLFED